MEVTHDDDYDDKITDTTVKHVPPKLEQARLAAEEEHNLSVWRALTENKRVVFWCIFFAFSAIGWYALPLDREILPRTMTKKNLKLGASMRRSMAQWLECLSFVAPLGEQWFICIFDA